MPFTMFVRIAAVLLLLFAVPAIAYPAVQDLAQLNIASLSTDDGGAIEFRATYLDANSVGSDATIGQTKNYQVFAGPVICTYRDEYRLFYYDIYLRNVAGGRWLHFVVTANPTGSFSDSFRDLQFTIAEGQSAEAGTLKLPLHGLSREDYLTAGKDPKPLPVRLGMANPVSILLQNRLSGMNLVVQSVALTYPDPDFWLGDAPQVTLNPALSLGAKPTTFDQVQIRPRAGKVIPSTFFRIGGSADTTLNVKFHYAAQSGGQPKDLEVAVPVQFVPSLLYLVLAVICGSLMGSTARLVDQKRRGLNAWLNALATASLGSALLELLGIVLVSLNSEFVLFGIKLDPFQFPQVLLMAALVGVFGGNISDLLRDALPKDKGEKPTPIAKTAVADGGAA
jgi:hypothetical protein